MGLFLGRLRNERRGERLPQHPALGLITLAITLAALAVPALCSLSRAAGQSGSPASPTQLVQQVVSNELLDRGSQKLWMYRVEKTIDAQTVSEVQVETTEGPVFRLLAIDGKPLSAEQRKKEDSRLHHLLQDPSEMSKLKEQHDDEQERLVRFTALLPQAFLYADDGTEQGDIRLRFYPNPAFDPPTFESRALTGSAGTLLIDPRERRIVEMRGQLITRIEFGYGLLGSIQKGGVFDFARSPVERGHWKTSRINVDVSGRIIFFKSIAARQREMRSNFKPVPPDLNLRQGISLLDSLQ